MDINDIKLNLIQAIDKNRDEIIKIGEEILKRPEIGYREENTSQIVRNKFSELEIAFTYPHAVTGVKGKIKGKSDGVNVCVLGELDAVKCKGHSFADDSGAAHACGHNVQIASMLGVAQAIKASGMMNELDGSVTFFAVPAEEFLDMDYRKSLRDSGIIKYFGGKQQIIYEGGFDDVDMSIMFHAQPSEPYAAVYAKGHNLGFLAKTVIFKGRATHGSKPFDGINALNAAAIAIIGIHSNRETFREEDKIRIHPIITKGGDAVNSVPDEVCVDMYIRGASLEAVYRGNKAVDRTVRGAAEIIGAEVEIEDIPGYLPICECEGLSDILEENAKMFVGSNIKYGNEIVGSTDLGDLSHLMPVIQPSVGGFQGELHSKQMEVCDKESAYILSTKILACTVADLLYNGCEKAKKIKDEFNPKLTKEEYIKYLNNERLEYYVD
ncbi:MAG: amidohydrolase [Clostridia bacterium]|nr:amidohydrolase [Clostridia bacterium]